MFFENFPLPFLVGVLHVFHVDGFDINVLNESKKYFVLFFFKIEIS